MFKTRMLARLVIPVLVATPLQTVVAGEPAGTAPPAESIREWKSTPIATPIGTPTGPARSIHEWKTTPVAAPDGNPCATPAANPAAAPATSSAPGPAAAVPVPKTPITISITSTLRNGTLVVVLDDAPIFSEKFQKPLLLISQTTTWDPLQVAAGTHRLTAKVLGTKKTYFSKTYDLHVSSTKGSGLRFVMQGDKLIVEVAS